MSLVTALLKLNPERDSHEKREVVQTHLNRCKFEGQTVFNVSVQNHEGITDLGETINTLAQGVSGASKDIVVSADKELLAITTELDVMKKDAEYTHKMVRNI